MFRYLARVLPFSPIADDSSKETVAVGSRAVGTTVNQ